MSPRLSSISASCGVKFIGTTTSQQSHHPSAHNIYLSITYLIISQYSETEKHNTRLIYDNKTPRARPGAQRAGQRGGRVPASAAGQEAALDGEVNHGGARGQGAAGGRGLHPPPQTGNGDI